MGSHSIRITRPRSVIAAAVAAFMLAACGAMPRAVEAGFPDLSELRVPHTGPSISGTFVDVAGDAVSGAHVRLVVLLPEIGSFVERVAVEGADFLENEEWRVDFGFGSKEPGDAVAVEEPGPISPYDPEWPDPRSVVHTFEFHTTTDDRGRFTIAFDEGTARLVETCRARMIVVAGDAAAHGWCDVRLGEEVELHAVEPASDPRREAIDLER